MGWAEDRRRTVSEVLSSTDGWTFSSVTREIMIDTTVLKLTDEDWCEVLAVDLSRASSCPKRYCRT